MKSTSNVKGGEIAFLDKGDETFYLLDVDSLSCID